MSVIVKYDGLDETQSEFEFFALSGTSAIDVKYNGTYIYGGPSSLTTFNPVNFLFSDHTDEYELKMETDGDTTYKLDLYKNGTLQDSATLQTDPVVTITHPTVTSSGGNTAGATTVTMTASGLSGVSLTGDNLYVVARSEPDVISGTTWWDHQCILYDTEVTETSDTELNDLYARYDYIAQGTNYGTSLRMYTDLGILYSVERTADLIQTDVENIVPVGADPTAIFPPVTAQESYYARIVTGADSYAPPFDADGSVTIPAPLVVVDGEVGDTEYLHKTLPVSQETLIWGFHNATDLQEKDHTSEAYVTWTQEIDFTNVGDAVT